MGVIQRIRKQWAVYWEVNDRPGLYDTDQYLPPVEIRCRWEDIRMEDRTQAGLSLELESRVFCDRVITEGGILRIGRLADVPDEFGLTPPPDARRVEKFVSIPDIKARQFLYIAYL